MENQNHCISIKQAELTSIILRNSFLNNGYVYVKQHENNNKNQSKIKRERMLKWAASNYLFEFVIQWQNGRIG